MAAVAVLLVVFLGLIAAATFGSVTGGLRLIGQQSEPEVLATTDLYFRLNDMDAQVANVLLVGGQRGRGIDRQQAQAIYEQDRVQADQDLQRAAVVAGSVPSAQQSLRSVLDGLGSYEALAGEAMYLDGQGSGSPRVIPIGPSPSTTTRWPGLLPLTSAPSPGRSAISAGQHDMNGWTGCIPAGSAILSLSSC